MHPDLKEILNAIYGDDKVKDIKLSTLIDAVNEMLLNLEYEVCINKKLATHFLNECALANDLLKKGQPKIH